MTKVAIAWAVYGPSDHEASKELPIGTYAVGLMDADGLSLSSDDIATTQIYEVTDDGYLIAGWDDPFPYMAVCIGAAPFLEDFVHELTWAFPGFMSGEEVNGADLIDFINEQLGVLIKKEVP